MRDINPTGDNWIDDAIEWVGEALEHIGSSAQLVTKTCVLDIKDFQTVLPNDLYYINQIAINESSEAAVIASELDSIREQLDNILAGENDYELNRINARLHVLENQYTTTGQTSILSYCTTNFPKSIHCESCVNENAVGAECYYIDNDRIKTSFQTGKICLSYTAFPIDDDCYPMIPDDISFKEAMFWYVYKKLLLGRGEVADNGIDYVFADGQWKYYCTQARNQANYPDIDRYESFMNQWVRLIPNINRHSEGFGKLGQRESLNRKDYDYLTTSTGFNSRGAGTKKATVSKPSTATFKANTASIDALANLGTSPYETLLFPQTSDIIINVGDYPISIANNTISIDGLSATTNIEILFKIKYTGAGDLNSGVVVRVGRSPILESFVFNQQFGENVAQGSADATAGDYNSMDIEVIMSAFSVTDVILEELTVKVSK